jgi:hypothetical protein
MSTKKQNANDLPEPSDDRDRKLLADVEQYGWHVIGIEEDAEGPSFAYSIGLYRTLKHPEIILFGLPVKVMHQIINAIGEEVRSGQRFEHLDESADFLEGYNVAFRTVERRYFPDYLGYARWFYRSDDFPVLQCVWPDSRHQYPWQPGYSVTCGRQPVLSEDKSWPFHEGKNQAAFTTRPVLEDNLPILLVSHDEDGDWQFLCGTTNRREDVKIVSLGCIFEHDKSLADLADLPKGWMATRHAKGTAWSRVQNKDQ